MVAILPLPQCVDQLASIGAKTSHQEANFEGFSGMMWHLVDMKPFNNLHETTIGKYRFFIPEMLTSLFKNRINRLASTE